MIRTRCSISSQRLSKFTSTEDTRAGSATTRNASLVSHLATKPGPMKRSQPRAQGGPIWAVTESDDATADGDENSLGHEVAGSLDQLLPLKRRPRVGLVGLYVVVAENSLIGGQFLVGQFIGNYGAG